MRTMRFSKASHFHPEQDSAASKPLNHYELFCEGLRALSAANSSTVFTSSPLEEENVPPVVEPIVQSGSSKAQPKNKNADQNFSTEAQVGSAECPASRLHSQNVSKHSQPCKSPDKSSGANELHQRSVNGSETVSGKNDQLARRTDGSPVDFVDHIIAVIRRDDALTSSSKANNTSPQANSESGLTRSSKKKSPCQESSKPGLEDANDREKISNPKHPKVSLCAEKKKTSFNGHDSVNLKSSLPSRKRQGTGTESDNYFGNQLPVQTNATSDNDHSESSEDLLNPSRQRSADKPRSSASSDGIRLRLSVSSSENDSGGASHCALGQVIACKTTDDETSTAARCRPFWSNPQNNLNKKITNNDHGQYQNDQENTPVSEEIAEQGLNSAESEKLVSKNAEHCSAETCSTQSKHPPRSALTSIPVIPSTTNNVVAGTSSPAMALASASQNEKSKLLSILQGVVAYVEVRSGPDNRSRGVCVQMRALGAETVDKFCKQVTHVVFNEGSPGILKRAQEQNCHLVSVLWIEACKSAGCIANESNYPPLNLHLYNTSNVINKYRKVKSLQPDFDDDKCEERINKHLRRIKRKAQREATQSQGTDSDDYGDVDPSPAESQHVDGVQVPRGVKLKRLSVVLNRLVPSVQSLNHSTSVTDKKQKKKLMPLERLNSDCSSIEEFDPRDRLKPRCPYIPPVVPPNRTVAGPLRRSGRQCTVPDSGLQKGSNQKHEGCIVRSRPSYKSRRSSVFIPRKPKRIHGVRGVSHAKNKNQRYVMRTMVCTFMHRREIDVVAAVLKQLGGWMLEGSVSSRTTHVVCGDAKRTVNLLRGIANGCWILHQEWVMRSLEAGHWLDEEPFELTAFRAVRQCRIEREALGSRPDIFSSVGPIYVAEKTSPPREDLEELLRLCGAHVVKSTRQARVIVGEKRLRASRLSVTKVKELWVLDSIQENVLKSYRSYYLK